MADVTANQHTASWFARRLRRIRRMAAYRVAWCVPQWGLSEFLYTVGTLLTLRAVRGSHPQAFATSVARSLGRRFGLPLNRARYALQLVMEALGIGQGDDVVVPSYICESVIDAIFAVGARPVLADVAEDLNISVDTVVAALTPRTRCVIVPHLFGKAAPIAAIERAIGHLGIAIIDDAAQSFGATCEGRPIGSFGIAGVVACGAGKALAGAAGAVLVTDDLHIRNFVGARSAGNEAQDTVLRRLASHWIWRRFRLHTLAFEPMFRKYFPEKERLTGPAGAANIDAAIGECQLRSSAKRARRRRENSALVAPLFLERGIRVVETFSPDGVALKLVAELPPSALALHEVIEVMADAGIECQGGYTPYHIAHAERATQMGVAQLPNTDVLWTRILCVPVERAAPTGRLSRALNRILSGDRVLSVD